MLLQRGRKLTGPDGRGRHRGAYSGTFLDCELQDVCGPADHLLGLVVADVRGVHVSYLQYNIAGSQAVRVRRHTSWRHSSVGKERRSVWFQTIAVALLIT